MSDTETETTKQEILTEAYIALVPLVGLDMQILSGATFPAIKDYDFLFPKPAPAPETPRPALPEFRNPAERQAEIERARVNTEREIGRLNDAILDDPAVSTVARVVHDNNEDIGRADRSLSIYRIAAGKSLSPRVEVGLDDHDRAHLADAAQGSRFYFQDPNVIAAAVIERYTQRLTDDHPISPYLTEDYRQALAAADDGRFVPLHEVGHAIGGQSEKLADGMMLERVAQHEENMPGKLKALAYMRILADIREERDPDYHGEGADVLLRIRHDLERRPEYVHGMVDGKHISAIEQVAQVIYAEPSDRAIRDHESVVDAKVYGSALIFPDLGDPKNPPEPPELTREGAVQLLLMQKAVEESTTMGSNNGLSRAMPQLWQDNPEVFAQAARYMHICYGMDAASPAPAATPPAPAVPRGPGM